MKTIKDLYQNGDWKLEKHVPSIEAAVDIKNKNLFVVTVSVGREIPHPNTTEHHIGL